MAGMPMHGGRLAMSADHDGGGEGQQCQQRSRKRRECSAGYQQGEDTVRSDEGEPAWARPEGRWGIGQKSLARGWEGLAAMVAQPGGLLGLGQESHDKGRYCGGVAW